MLKFIGNSSPDAGKARKVLNDSGIKFTEIFSSHSHHNRPILIDDSSAFPHKGIAQIRQYCNYVTENRMC